MRRGKGKKGGKANKGRKGIIGWGRGKGKSEQERKGNEGKDRWGSYTVCLLACTVLSCVSLTLYSPLF